MRGGAKGEGQMGERGGGANGRERRGQRRGAKGEQEEGPTILGMLSCSIFQVVLHKFLTGMH